MKSQQLEGYNSINKHGVNIACSDRHWTVNVQVQNDENKHGTLQLQFSG